MLKGNKGEWSEIYVFLRLLLEGKLYAADSDLETIQELYYPVLQLIRDDSGSTIVYSRNEEKVIATDVSNNQLIGSYDYITLEEKATYLYDKIQMSESTFGDEILEDTIKEMGIKKLKASSTDKSDIRLKLHDIHTGINSVYGFSIKSQMGNPSTLLNAGKSTNFIYLVKGLEHLTDNEIAEINRIANGSKIRDRLLKIYELGGKLVYQRLSNEVFDSNMQIIDTHLPAIIAESLLLYYRGFGPEVSKIVKNLEELNPLHYDQKHGHQFYQYKIRNLLTDIALGMVPSITWTGRYDANGGYIIVKRNGEVVCYHIYNRNEFQDYLLNNTRFETASSSRYQFGTIERADDQLLFTLNLQIRFR